MITLTCESLSWPEVLVLVATIALIGWLVHLT